MPKEPAFGERQGRVVTGPNDLTEFSSCEAVQLSPLPQLIPPSSHCCKPLNEKVLSSKTLNYAGVPDWHSKASTKAQVPGTKALGKSKDLRMSVINFLS